MTGLALIAAFSNLKWGPKTIQFGQTSVKYPLCYFMSNLLSSKIEIVPGYIIRIHKDWHNFKTSHKVISISI